MNYPLTTTHNIRQCYYLDLLLPEDRRSGYLRESSEINYLDAPTIPEFQWIKLVVELRAQSLLRSRN